MATLELNGGAQAHGLHFGHGRSRFRRDRSLRGSGGRRRGRRKVCGHGRILIRRIAGRGARAHGLPRSMSVRRGTLLGLSRSRVSGRVRFRHGRRWSRRRQHGGHEQDGPMGHLHLAVLPGEVEGDLSSNRYANVCETAHLRNEGRVSRPARCRSVSQDSGRRGRSRSRQGSRVQYLHIHRIKNLFVKAKHLPRRIVCCVVALCRLVLLCLVLRILGLLILALCTILGVLFLRQYCGHGRQCVAIRGRGRQGVVRGRID
jgi:hypothetical protein